MKILKRTLEFFIGSFIGALILGACGAYPIGVWNGKIYSFSVKDQAFERLQDHEIVPATDAMAGNMLCMTNSDLKLFIQTYVAPPVKSPKDSGS